MSFNSRFLLVPAAAFLMVQPAEAYEQHRLFHQTYEQRLGLAARARYHAVQIRYELNHLRDSALGLWQAARGRADRRPPPVALRSTGRRRG